LGWCLVIGWLIFTAGCATKPKGPSAGPVFFPPAPDDPRIQFLTAFNSERALGSQGKFSEFVVGKERVHRPIWKPYGLATTKGFIYVCDTQPANVGVVDLKRRRLRYFKPEGNAALQLPINIAVDQDGTRYITDTKRQQVLIFDAKDQLVATLGQRGDMKPCGVAVTADRLYVTDMTNHCVRVYDKTTRQQLLQVPRDPAEEKGKLFQPTNVAVDGAGRIYVADTAGFAVKIFDARGDHVRTVGDLGLNPGTFALPKGIDVDREGRLYVVDAATAVTQLFDAEGRLLMFFGEPKSSGPAALYLPAGLRLDYENTEYFQKFVAPGYRLEYLILVTNQAGPNKVAVYGFLARQ
jgi:DNA-binding beta-propeller fold protein YncE